MPIQTSYLFLTQPPSNLPTRRRDPFGFSAPTAYFSDLLAPDLTNRVRDARWMAILCWSLQQVRNDFGAPVDQSSYYALLRGLELRWVIQTCRLLDQGRGRQVPGSRTVRRLLESGQTPKVVARILRVEMGNSQWDRYRYVGPFAAYRQSMRAIGLLDEDGLQPTAIGARLARIVDKKIRTQLRTAKVNSNGKLSDEQQGWVAYWMRRWPCTDNRPRTDDFLPTREPSLSPVEAELLRPLLFAEDSVRHRVAVSLGQVNASNHATLCVQLQKDLLAHGSWSPDDRVHLRKLGAFAGLADSAVETLRAIFFKLQQSASGTMAVAAVARQLPKLLELQRAVKAWKPDGIWPVVDLFCARFMAATSNEARIVAIVRFHEEHSGGLQWVRYKGGKLDRLARHEQPPSGLYRFRLDALSRLAAGCGVIDRRPSCFEPEARDTEDEEDEISDNGNN